MNRRFVSFGEININFDAICSFEIVKSNRSFSIFVSTLKNDGTIFDPDEEFPNAELAEAKIKEMVSEETFKNEIIVFENFYIFKNKISFFDIRKRTVGRGFMNRIVTVNGLDHENRVKTKNLAEAWLQTILKQVNERDLLYVDSSYNLKDHILTISVDGPSLEICIEMLGGWTTILDKRDYKTYEEAAEGVRALIKEIES